MTHKPRTAGAALGALALLAAVGGLAWMAIEQERSSPSLRIRATASPAVSHRIDSRRLPVLEPFIEAAPAARVSTVESRVALKPGDIEICGVGVYKQAADAQRALQRLALPDIEDTIDAHLRHMAASPDAATRAAAWMGSRDAAPLVKLALQSPDPTVYAMAQSTCAWYEPTKRHQACQMVNAEQVARLDADNAAPWLVIAAQAHARGEADAADAAMHRASVATQIRYRVLDFAPLAMAAVPRDMPLVMRLQLRIAIIGMQAALPMSQYATASKHCDAASVVHANRRQTCSALAELMVGTGRTLLDLQIGQRIGERVGWTQERTETLRAHAETLTHAMVNQTSGPEGGMLSCANVEQFERHGLAYASTLGERAAAEQLVARSGLSRAQLKARYHQHMQRWVSTLPPTASDSAASDAPSKD